MRKFLALIASLAWMAIIPWSVFHICQQDIPAGVPAVEKLLPQELLTEAKTSFSQLQTRNFAPIRASLAPEFINPNLDDNLNRTAALIPNEKPVSIAAMGYKYQKIGDGADARIFDEVTLQYRFSHTVLLYTYTRVAEKGVRRISGVTLTNDTLAILQKHKVRLDRMNVTQAATLAVAAGLLLFNGLTLYLSLATRGLRLFWLWAVFILFGFGKIAFDWTALTYGLQWQAFQIPVVTTYQPYYQAFQLKLSLPVGSLLFLIALAAHHRQAAKKARTKLAELSAD